MVQFCMFDRISAAAISFLSRRRSYATTEDCDCTLARLQLSI